MKRIKSWMRVSIILVVAICAAGAGIITAIHARATSAPASAMNCQVYFSDGPNAGNTEPVAFVVTTDNPNSGPLTSYSSTYVGGVSTSGSWHPIEESGTLYFTFTAQLVSPPSANLSVYITFPDNYIPNSVVGTGQGTITDSSGNVLVVTHTTTTCPGSGFSFVYQCLACTFAVPPGDANPRVAKVA